MKNNKVQQPFIPTDGLELYYDVKGKKNTDNYKGTLLDMSGKGRHGTLSNFAYEGVSGFTGTTEGGLLLDDIDDKIVRPAINGIEYTSASRNLFKVQTNYTINETNITGLKPNTAYTMSSNVPVLTTPNHNLYFGTLNTGVDINHPVTITSDSSGIIWYRIYPDREQTANLLSGMYWIQVEEGSVATPYTPYIPLPIMTYQMNGNILSFEKDGTVKRTTKDVNGNEVVVSRKGINLVRNGNFANQMNHWTLTGGTKASVDENGELKITYLGSISHELSSSSLLWNSGDKYYVSMLMKTDFVNEINMTQNGGGVTAKHSGSGKYERLELVITANSNIPSVMRFVDSGRNEDISHRPIFVKECQIINLTEAYRGQTTPTIAYIQSHPEEFSWTPNPNDLIETVEIKNNLVGDLENLQGNDFEQHEDGVVTYTNEAEEGSVVRVDIDGISFQDVGSGKNIFYKNEVYSKDSEINDDCLNISIGDRFFYQIDGVHNAQYTTSFDYKRDNATAPVSMSFYYTDGTSDDNPQLMSSSDRVRLTLSSAIGKTVSGVGYNPPVVLGCSWKKISNPTMERTGLSLSLAQEDESLGVRWNKLQNPIMERV